MLKYLDKLPHPWKKKRKPVVTVLRLDGVISSQGRFGQGLSIGRMASAIEAAFDPSNLKAVALVINSPGGSPVQSNLIYKRIRSFADEKGIPVFTFTEDVAASGGYWLALAGDEIFADESSVIGSIGVLSAGFGFDKVLEKLGIERRVHTAGENKAMLDPFQPEDPEDIKRLTAIQKDVHKRFKEMVKERRGDRLKGSDKKLFSGEYWTGAQALKYGLVDGIGDVRTVMRKRFGSKVRILPVSPERQWWQRGRQGADVSHETVAGRASQGWVGGLMQALEAKALWSKFRL